MSSPTIYFGYGSNLWLHQMSLRCPTSRYLGIARLGGYKWLINGRGYANVVSVSVSASASQSAGDKEPEKEEEKAMSKYDNAVFGTVYSLAADDEKALDKNEGVPVAYTKEWLACEFWSAGSPSLPGEEHGKVDTDTPPTDTRDMLVYIDRRRITPDVPRKEYVYRMNRGIDDAVRLGVPREYVEGVMRKFIPTDEDEGGEQSKGIEEFAARQAAQFRDESGVLR